MKELCTDRKKFGDEVQEKAQKDMNALGIEIISCNIQRIDDENGLIVALGQDNMSQIQKDAAIAKALADRDVAIAAAEAKRQANEAEVASQTDIATRQNELKIKEADLKKISDAKKAEADAAYEIEKENQRKSIEITTADANIAREEKAVELRRKEAEVKEQELSATIRKQAEAEKYRQQQIAEAELYKRQKDAEAKKFEIERDAEALRISADASKYQAEQEAEAIRAKGKTTLRLFNIGLAVRQLYFGDSNLDSKGWKHLLRPLVALFDKVIFSKVRQNFGGELRFFIGGGALLDKDLQKFYVGIGIPMYQGYGLSEATPVISSNGPDLYRFGSSGKLVKPIEITICDADGKELPVGEMGEIVVKGENVMAGYWKNPESTAETVKNGRLYTGDLGYMSHEGLLYVKGRFKSLLISSDGEKYSPEGIEEALVEKSCYIDQVMLYNNQSAYTVALVVPNREQLSRKLKEGGLSLNTEEGRKAALQKLESELNKFKRGGEYEGMFPERWLPSCFAVLAEPFTEQNKMINSTMKMVRGRIEKAYEDRIKYLYTAEGKTLLNQQNIDALR